MFETLFILVLTFTSYRLGKASAVNIDIQKQTDHMQGLIDKAYEKRDFMKNELRNAEEYAETWKRRYLELVDSINEEELND